MSGDGWTHIDSVHKRIHLGSMYHVLADGASLDTSDTVSILVFPADNAEIHAEFFGSASGASKLELFENPTVSANGSALTAYNVNRNKNGSMAGTAYKDPTVTDAGTKLDGIQLSGGVGAGLGGAVSSRHEWILDSSKSYLLRLTSQANGVNATIVMNGYIE